ncbi:serine protease grass [Bactrocera oleae]|uniref:serine protease grass n=1 Tax=Bactrocera oleae TaxID=104688 RepID=UPI00387EA8B5
MDGLNLSLLAIILLFCCGLNLNSADTYYCKGNNRYGTCLLYENCTSPDIVRNNADCQRSGLSGDVVCCLRRKRRPGRRITKTATILENEALNSLGLALLNQHNCGRMGNDRLFNGVDAMLGEFPWMAILLNSQKNTMCGGSVITNRFVLTAAHCIRSELQFVRLGEHDLSTEEDCLSINLCQTYVDFGIDPMQQPLIHPDYDTVSKYKDVALIKLDRDIDFQVHHHIKPICLPTSRSDYAMLPTQDLMLAGWGLTEANDVRGSDILQTGHVKLEALDICQKLYSKYNIGISKICVMSGANRTVSCQGDSGSPIFWATSYLNVEFWQKRYTQIGLVSLGSKECGRLTSIPYPYENVTDAMPWITNTILR